ncbi:uncharacterized protein B0J16DRAFT_397919 [Fusarium flagelliforme]|uniref:uncharacterized protein n=1 Tax=Fusarium flagelliforme TaxID=2675880 RepID=UPI001E8CC26D|nr:uncharacterized protein B0J16DRAFT_397919 [Fusarium flagelliforme]KAH7184575.1 hypothetical protein B0J16DRAFT_397919 [Fusarium flagelliforme]
MRPHYFAIPALCAAATISKACETAPKRVEWRQMDESARKQYIDAVRCLTTKPSRIGLDTTLYDDFPYIHSQLDQKIHSVASFLPWHRYFVHVYESALKECGYEGVMPKCVDDGPFKDFYPAYLGGDYDPHCLSRNWNDGRENVGNMLSENYNKEAVDKVQNIDNYNDYRYDLEGGPHGAIHASIGGDMGPSTSPNDPIFFLHHAQIDRLWWLWQEVSPKTRYTEFSGIKTQDQFDGTTPPPASLDDILLMNGLAEDLKVKDLMTIKSSLLCYTY